MDQAANETRFPRSRVWGLVSGVWGLRLWVWGVGCGVWGLDHDRTASNVVPELSAEFRTWDLDIAGLS